MELHVEWYQYAADLRQYLPDAQVHAVQGFVQRRSDALGRGDGALWALLLHVCEKMLCVGFLALRFTLLCDDVQSQFLPPQNSLHASSFWLNSLALFPLRIAGLLPDQSSIFKLHCITGIFRFDRDQLPILHHEELLWE